MTLYPYIKLLCDTTSFIHDIIPVHYLIQPLSFVFISMTLYPYIKLLCDTTLIFRCPFAKYFVFVFSKINFLPYYISATIRYTHSLFKSHFSEKTKNIVFCDCITNSVIYIWDSGD